MIFHIKNNVHLSLIRLLKRKKMSLEQFILEQNIKTYQDLQDKCANLHIIVPTLEEFGRNQQEKIIKQDLDSIIEILVIDDEKHQNQENFLDVSCEIQEKKEEEISQYKVKKRKKSFKA